MKKYTLTHLLVASVILGFIGFIIGVFIQYDSSKNLVNIGKQTYKKTTLICRNPQNFILHKNGGKICRPYPFIAIVKNYEGSSKIILGKEKIEKLFPQTPIL